MPKISITIDTDTMEVSGTVDGREAELCHMYLSHSVYEDFYDKKRKYFHLEVTEKVEESDNKRHSVNHCWDADVEVESAESAKVTYKTENKDGLIPTQAWVKYFQTPNSKGVIAQHLNELFSKK